MPNPRLGRKPTGNAKVHVTVRLPQELMRQIDLVCQNTQLTRNEVIEEAIREQICAILKTE